MRMATPIMRLVVMVMRGSRTGGVVPQIARPTALGEVRREVGLTPLTAMPTLTHGSIVRRVHARAIKKNNNNNK